MGSSIKSIYICTSCGAQFPKWSGRCLECGKWDTLSMEMKDTRLASTRAENYSPATTIDLSTITADASKRVKTNINEVDRVLGGGLVPGSLTLLSGEPGIGKSTIVMQIACRISEGHKVLYISGEESALQVKGRFDRLNCGKGDFGFANETNLEKIIATIDNLKPELVVIDSIQTVYSANCDSESGSLSQIRSVTASLLELAKAKEISVIVVGHVTKDGAIAGPKSLEHMVDTVIYLETDKREGYRLLRASKNRFGSVNELGIFNMTGKGFEEISNPSAIFLEKNEENFPGSVISSITQGSRPFLIEIQALVSKTLFGYPQRKVSGYDINRLQVLTAVLTKRANVNLSNQDVIINVVGGMKISDPGIDSAICLAIASSLLNQIVQPDILVVGEVGLGGEIRGVSRLEDRLKIAVEMGFKEAIIPSVSVRQSGIKLTKTNNLKTLIKAMVNK